MVANSLSEKDPDKARGTDGLLSFLSRVLEQLSISAWLPATMLIGVGTLLVQLHQNGDLDISRAVYQIANQSWGILVVLLIGIVLTTMMTQAFSFGFIRFLEGYWGPSALFNPFIRFMVRWHVWRKARRSKQVIDLEKKLFESARARLLQEEEPKLVDVWEAQVYRVPKANRRQKDEDIITEALQIDWREKADPSLVALFYRAVERMDGYPALPTRVLPTALGNVLRSAEDSLGLSGHQLERFVMENYERIPARLMSQHDQFRDRLDMYSMLTLVFFGLAVTAFPLLWDSNGTIPWVPAVVGLMLFAVLSWLSYVAAIASARAYGAVLRAMNVQVKQHTSQPR